ncbi:hypothetical protein M758_10G066700 [Ceratodon purpureus]|nr:hypothetical protein M758_10G066000 [Ceratodon purpureus]KAG0603099.1 hypothetical protein M758_10G066700 [Ceratodon purpureus]
MLQLILLRLHLNWTLPVNGSGRDTVALRLPEEGRGSPVSMASSTSGEGPTTSNLLIEDRF